jgi:preprotein translocase subunit SecG
MLNILLTGHIVIAVIIIILILVQHGKGADMGAAFGSGSSQTVFGSKGAAPFLMKLTGFLAAVFFVTSLSMGVLSKQYAGSSNFLPTPVQQGVPAKSDDLLIPNTAPVTSAPVPVTPVSSGETNNAVPVIPEGK